MWPSSLLRAGLCLLPLSASVAQAQYWTVTSRFYISLTTSTIGTWTDEDMRVTRTRTHTIRPEATITAVPVSTSVSTRTYDDLAIVRVFYGPAASIDSDAIITTTTRRESNKLTQYIVPVTYVAPASCPTPFTVSTSRVVYIPSQVADQLRPTSTRTSVIGTTSPDPDDWLTRVDLYLTQNAAPLTVTSDAIWTYYVQSCRNPTATGDAYWGPDGRSGSGSGSGSSGGGSGSSLDDWGVCSALTGCTTLRVWIIVVATLLPTLFILGFVESWFWYRRLMNGQFALRFGTVFWILLSLWVLCFTRTQPARSPQDQAELKRRWKAMPGGEKWKNWWRWGFRHAYPVALLGDPTTGAMPPAQYAAPPPPGTGLYGPPGQGGPAPYGSPAGAPGPYAPYPYAYPGGVPPPGMISIATTPSTDYSQEKYGVQAQTAQVPSPQSGVVPVGAYPPSMYGVPPGYPPTYPPAQPQPQPQLQPGMPAQPTSPPSMYPPYPAELNSVQQPAVSPVTASTASQPIYEAPGNALGSPPQPGTWNATPANPPPPNTGPGNAIGGNPQSTQP